MTNNLFNQNMLPQHLLILCNLYLRNYAMTSLCPSDISMIHESNICIKLLEYQVSGLE